MALNRVYINNLYINRVLRQYRVILQVSFTSFAHWNRLDLKKAEEAVNKLL